MRQPPQPGHTVRRDGAGVPDSQSLPDPVVVGGQEQLASKSRGLAALASTGGLPSFCSDLLFP